MKKALVQSVGTGTRPDMDITKPLLWHCGKSGAAYVVWIVSEDSRPNAEKMAQALGLPQNGYAICRVSGVENVEALYRECLAVFRDLAARGFRPETIEVDYTSGTKAMTAGLALAAVAFRCGTLSYISGEKQSGVVIEGTERLVPVEPRRIWADETLRLARDFCFKLRFDAALTLLDGLNRAWLGEYEQELADGLRAAAKGYGAWDRFDYAQAIGELAKVMRVEAAELRGFQPDPSLPKRLEALKLPKELCEHPERDPARMAASLREDRLADLFNNAQRRLDEGRYDDALARLYRLAEMLAQWSLHKEFGIDSSDVDVSRVPSTLRAELETHRNREGKIQIGLDLDYRLLNALDHPVGKAFMDDSKLGVLLKKRNNSLLAHGVVPIAKKEVESLREKLEALVATAVPDLSERRALLQFPWLRGSGPGIFPVQPSG